MLPYFSFDIYYIIFIAFFFAVNIKQKIIKKRQNNGKKKHSF